MVKLPPNSKATSRAPCHPQGQRLGQRCQVWGRWWQQASLWWRGQMVIMVISHLIKCWPLSSFLVVISVHLTSVSLHATVPIEAFDAAHVWCWHGLGSDWQKLDFRVASMHHSPGYNHPHNHSTGAGCQCLPLSGKGSASAESGECMHIHTQMLAMILDDRARHGWPPAHCDWRSHFTHIVFHSRVWSWLCKSRRLFPTWLALT